MECILPVSSVHGIFQAKVLEWVAIAFPEDLPNPGTELGSPALRADTLPPEPPGKDPGPPGKFRTILRPYSSVPIIHYFSETSKLLVEIFPYGYISPMLYLHPDSSFLLFVFHFLSIFLQS